MKKILTALLIGAFVFGVGTADMNFASAKSVEKTIADAAKDKVQQKLDGNDEKKPPEPPKDSNGNPLPPPDKDKNSKHVKNGDKTSADSDAKNSQHRNKNSADEKNPPESPKDSNGKPLPPAR